MERAAACAVVLDLEPFTKLVTVSRGLKNEEAPSITDAVRMLRLAQ